MNLTERYFKVFESGLRDQLKKKFKIDDDAFEKSDEKHSVKSIAKTKDGWIGFSHRAVMEFKKGDMLFDETFGKELDEEEVSKMLFKDRGFKKIENEEDCKQAAKNFSRYVS